MKLGRFFESCGDYPQIHLSDPLHPLIPDMSDVLLQISTAALTFDAEESEDLIDFRKCQRIASIISDVRKYQRIPPVKWESSACIQKWLKHLRIHINQIKGSHSSNFDLPFREFSRSLIASHRHRCKEDAELWMPSVQHGTEVRVSLKIQLYLPIHVDLFIFWFAEIWISFRYISFSDFI